MNSSERTPIGNFTESKDSVIPMEIKEKPTSLGVAVLIVGLGPGRNGEHLSDPLIWTITELKNKPETSKSAGQISIPAETRKNGEGMEDNVIGALAEFCDDTVFPSYIKQHLIRMDGKWYREKGIFVGVGPADVAVLIYDGALDFPFIPTYPDEVSPNGWMKKSELIRDPKLRDILKQALELDDREGLIREALEIYHSDPEKRKSVFPESLNSIMTFSAIREFGVDVSTMPRDAKEVAKRLPAAQKLIFEAMRYLTEAQNQERRDYDMEDKIVSELQRALRSMDYEDYAVGIGELDGVGIGTVKVPKTWWEKNRNYKKLYQKVCHESGPNIYRLQLTTGKSVKKSWGSWSLHRGDKLGYPEELGRNWYLVFQERPNINNDAPYNYGIAPINGIGSLKLIPYNAHGF